MKAKSILLSLLFILSHSAFAGSLLGANAKPSTVDRDHAQVSPNKQDGINNVGSTQSQIAAIDVQEVSTSFDRDEENPCDHLFVENGFKVNEEIRDCRIRVAKSRPGNIQACRASANGSDDDYNNCLANRGVSQNAIDLHRDHLEDLAELEAEMAEKQAQRDAVQSSIPDNFVHDRKNSIARTFHFWEILEQHHVPVLYGKTRNSSYRVISYSYGPNGVEYNEETDRVTVLNNPDKACQMLRDENDNFFEAAAVKGGRPLALVGFPDVTPFRQDLRNPDFNNGRPYNQASETMGIGKNGEYIKARQNEKESWYHSSTTWYLHYLKITCVRRLKDNEEANEDLWKEETRSFDRSFQELFTFRDEQKAGNAQDQGSIPAAEQKPIFLPNGTVIYPGGGSQGGSDSDYYTPTGGGSFTSGVSAD